MIRSSFRCARATAGRNAAIVLMGLVLGGPACSLFTDVDAPGIIEPPQLRNPAGATALYVGALTLFAAAYNGGDPNTSTVGASGILADELWNASIDARWDVLDSRQAGEDASGVGLPLTMLSQARVSALSAVQVIQQVAPAPSSRIGQLFAISGYTEVLLGELYCAGVSLASVEGGEPVAYGRPLTGDEMFQRAVADFDSAFTYSADSARILNLARVGRGRALLNRGHFDEAAQAVAQVPTSFSYATEHSTAVVPNRLNVGFTLGHFTVSDREGANGVDFRTAGDPRVATVFLALGSDGQTDVFAWTPALAAGRATAAVLASGVEARLIEAEAALRAGGASTWLSIHNALRAAYPDTAISNHPLADPGTAAARVDLHFRERAFWLFLTAHRHGDLRRLIRQYGRSRESVFPTGPYRAGRVYGEDVNVAIPRFAESQNPHYVGCLSRDP